MKLVLASLVALAVGVGLGILSTSFELGDDYLPVPLAERVTQGRPIAIVVNGDHHNFGKMQRNGKSSHEFIVRNDGTEPLSLTTGDTTCKCTLFKAGSGTLAPGESTKVKLEWTAKTGDEEFSQSAELRTNDPDRQVIRLVIEGKIFEPLKADRREVNFGTIVGSEPVSGVFRLLAFENKTLELASHEFSQERAKEKFKLESRPLTAEELTESDGATAGLEIRISLDSGLPLGALSQTIKMKTTAENLPMIELPIMATVVSDLSLSGPKVNQEKGLVSLGVLPRGKELKHTVFVLVKGPYRDDVQLTIDYVDPSTSLQAKLGEPSRDNPKIVRYPLEIIVPADATPVQRVSGGGFGQIKFKTTHPETKEFKVFVNFAVSE